MPYTAKQAKFFRAVAHGFKPDDPNLGSLSQSKAKELSAEADSLPTKKAVKPPSPQKKAISAALAAHHRQNNND
jgi:hypothetical protein